DWEPDRTGSRVAGVAAVPSWWRLSRHGLSRRSGEAVPSWWRRCPVVVTIAPSLLSLCCCPFVQEAELMRFVFAPPAEDTSGLLTLPWREPLETWQDERIVEIRQRGI